MISSAVSCRREIHPRRVAYLRFLSQIHQALDEAMAGDLSQRRVTISAIAKKLGVNKSVLSRKLRGQSNLTIESIADIAWALDRDTAFSLPLRDASAMTRSNASLLRLPSPDQSDAREDQVVASGAGYLFRLDAI
jgi:transcriptional regulator with XRE-family HTH domain